MKEVIDSIRSADTITVLTGAGMSVESGIAPFRGEDGLWEEFDPQEMASARAFSENPERCWKLFKLQIEECLKSEPHEGYYSLVNMEEYGLDSVITQNIDGLHKRAGSSEVLEIHGSLEELVCPSCGSRFKTENHLNEIKNGEIPHCECGSILRPDVVLFGESLPQAILEKAWERTEKSDLMLVIGTSSIVQPAASIPVVGKRTGSKIIEINLDRTPLTDDISDIFLEGKAGKTLEKIEEEL